MQKRKIDAIKVISIIVGVVGLFYLVGGVAAFISGCMIHSSMFRGSTLSKLPFGLFTTGRIYTSIGLLAFIAMFGLFRCRNWARSYWLRLTIAIFAFSILDFICGLRISFNLSDLFDPIFALCVAIISWVFLSKPSIKEIFKQNIQQNKGRSN